MQYEINTGEQPSGWFKPQREPTLAELKVLIAETEKHLATLKQQAFNLEQGPRLEAIAQIRNIMRAQQLTVADIAKR